MYDQLIRSSYNYTIMMVPFCGVCSGRMNLVDWSGVVEWNTGVEYWTGLLEWAGRYFKHVHNRQN